jgi:8-oxo-dGTP pyrophosphatase MutT (NUDIX family)
MNGASAICLPVNNALFNFRVAGVAVQNGKVLLHKGPADNFWSLPGGRVDLFEFSRETLLREMLEEIGKTVQVGSLVAVVENFFEYNGIKHHEIGFYYRMEMKDPGEQSDFIVAEDSEDMLFHWEDVDSIVPGSIYPDFVSPGFLRNMTFQHINLNFQNLNFPAPIS